MVDVYAFHLMPYPYLPENFIQEYRTPWVLLPNSNYDPIKGRELYFDYLEQLEFADRLGFDGVVVNEHHQTAYGNMPSPNLIGALLARTVKNAKIAILGNAISLHAAPHRVAEEVAILDVITGGRIISGFVRGIGAEYFSYRNVNPLDSKEKFYEAHDLILKAWNEPGPFEFHGKHYKFPYVNIWPRPIQQPNPPIWLPSQGSADTIQFAAKNKYVYLQTLSPIQAMKESFALYREEAEKEGYVADSSRLGWSHSIYVAETDAKAWEEAEGPMMFFFEKLLNMPPEMRFPPGYLSEDSMKRILAAKKDRSSKTFKQLYDEGFITVGSPETVRQRLTELHKEMKYGQLIAHLHKGNMPHWMAMKNMELFAREVMPHIKKL